VTRPADLQRIVLFVNSTLITTGANVLAIDSTVISPPAGTADNVVEGLENSPQATNLETVHTLIAASASNPPLYQERQQLTDPLAVRF